MAFPIEVFGILTVSLVIIMLLILLDNLGMLNKLFGFLLKGEEAWNKPLRSELWLCNCQDGEFEIIGEKWFNGKHFVELEDDNGFKRQVEVRDGIDFFKLNAFPQKGKTVFEFRKTSNGFAQDSFMRVGNSEQEASYVQSRKEEFLRNATLEDDKSSMKSLNEKVNNAQSEDYFDENSVYPPIPVLKVGKGKGHKQFAKPESLPTPELSDESEVNEDEGLL